MTGLGGRRDRVGHGLQDLATAAISTTAGTDLDLETILELAQDAGFKTGNVTTAEITDATPAVLDSHVTPRGCQGPPTWRPARATRSRPAARGSIAEQTVDHHVDVVLGGGKARFDQVIPVGQPNAGTTVIQHGDGTGLPASSPTTRASTPPAARSRSSACSRP